MEIKKYFIIISCIVIIIFVGITIWLGLSNIELREELVDRNTEIESIQIKLEDYTTKLSNKSDSINVSNLFFNTYLQGLGTYYDAIEIQDAAVYRSEQAFIKYNDGYWSKSLAWYWDAMDWYSDAGEKYREARDVFENASKYATNITYKLICQIYSDMMNLSSNAMIYAYEASDYYSKACEYYLNSNYNAAHASRDQAILKMSFHNEEMVQFENYQEELNNILIRIN